MQTGQTKCSFAGLSQLLKWIKYSSATNLCLHQLHRSCVLSVLLPIGDKWTATGIKTLDSAGTFNSGCGSDCSSGETMVISEDIIAVGHAAELVDIGSSSALVCDNCAVTALVELWSVRSVHSSKSEELVRGCSELVAISVEEIKGGGEIMAIGCSDVLGDGSPMLGTTCRPLLSMKLEQALSVVGPGSVFVKVMCPNPSSSSPSLSSTAVTTSAAFFFLDDLSLWPS